MFSVCAATPFSSVATLERVPATFLRALPFRGRRVATMNESWSRSFWLDLGPERETVSCGVVFPREQDDAVTDWTDPMPAELWEPDQSTTMKRL